MFKEVHVLANVLELHPYFYSWLRQLFHAQTINKFYIVDAMFIVGLYLGVSY